MTEAVTVFCIGHRFVSLVAVIMGEIVKISGEAPWTLSVWSFGDKALLCSGNIYY